MQNTLVNITHNATTDRAPVEKKIRKKKSDINDTASESTASRVAHLSDNVRFLTRLQFRDAQGNYVMATESQILEEAVRAIDHRYPTCTSFTSPEISEEFSRAKLAGLGREVFAVAFLNNQNQLLANEELFQGSISSVEIHPREVVIPTPPRL